MSKILLGIVIGAFALFAWQRAHQPEPRAYSSQAVADSELEEQPAVPEQPAVEEPPTAAVANEDFHCDGRVYCSQMTSCEEATYFLRNCPDVKMDGEGDGVPCEKQWCGHQ